jgi:hypothetical protein
MKKRRRPDLEPELAALLEPRRIERAVPPDIRERALANARAIVAAGGVISSARPPARRWASAPMAPARPRRRLWIALTASLAVAGAAVGAGAALRMRAADAPTISLVGVLVVPAARVRPAPAEPATPVTERAPAAKRSRETRPAGDRDPLVLEIELLQRAHAAYTRGDVAASLKLATEHARRFPNGRLAEEREALRVRSLARIGRKDEARRAAAAFAVRFPRSILLPRLEDGTGVPP